MWAWPTKSWREAVVVTGAAQLSAAKIGSVTKDNRMP